MKVPETAPIARLRRIMAALEAQRTPPADDAAWIIAGVRRYQAGREAGLELHLDRALGLTGPARHGWWTMEALEERNRLLRVVRAECYADLTDADTAAAILAVLRRPASRSRQPAANQDAWAALRAAVARTGRALPCHKHLTRLLGSTLT